MNIEKDQNLQNIANCLKDEGFKKHRRSFEIFTGAVIAINILGADLSSSNPLGIPLKNSDRPELLSIVLFIIGAYLFYRYLIAMNAYIYPHLKSYFFNKRKVYIEEELLKTVTTGYENQQGRWVNQEKPKWNTYSTEKKRDMKTYHQYSSVKYVYEVLDNNRQYQKTGKTYITPFLTRLDIECSLRIELHYKEGAIGWDIWMPYYLLILAIGTSIYNYFY